MVSNQIDVLSSLFIHSFIHSLFPEYLLCIWYLLDTRDTVMTKLETVLSFRVFEVWQGKQALSKQLHN